MKLLLSVLLFAELFFTQFSELDVVNPVIGYGPISFYLRFLLFGVCFLLMFAKIATSRRVSPRDLIILVGIAFSWLYSLALGASVARIIGESFNFILPLIVAAVVTYCNVSVRKLLQVLFITCFVGGILSLLIATKVIAVDIWSHEFGLVRTAVVIDGTLGLVGIVAAICCIGNRELAPSRLLWAMGLVGSMAIILFGLSRLRFITLFLFLIIYVIENMVSKKNFVKSFRVVAVLVGAIALFTMLKPDILSYLYDTMSERFLALGNDGSSQVRSEEWRLHLQLLWDSYGFGQGWGIGKNFSLHEGGSALYVHNVYSGLLMHLGLVFGGLYIGYLLSLFFNAARQYIRQSERRSLNGLVVYELFALILLGFGAAGITQAGAMFVMCIVYASQNEEILVYEESRNPDLS